MGIPSSSGLPAELPAVTSTPSADAGAKADAEVTADVTRFDRQQNAQLDREDRQQDAQPEAHLDRKDFQEGAQEEDPQEDPVRQTCRQQTWRETKHSQREIPSFSDLPSSSSGTYPREPLVFLALDPASEDPASDVGEGRVAPCSWCGFRRCLFTCPSDYNRRVPLLSLPPRGRLCRHCLRDDQALDVGYDSHLRPGTPPLPDDFSFSLPASLPTSPLATPEQLLSLKTRTLVIGPFGRVTGYGFKGCYLLGRMAKWIPKVLQDKLGATWP